MSTPNFGPRRGLGHEMIVFAPGEHHEVNQARTGRGAGDLAVAAAPGRPALSLFRRRACLHAALDAWQPDHIEASSPWSSATTVGRWQGAASRSLVMHSDPLAAYAYRWLGGLVAIDRDRPLVRPVLAAPARARTDVRHRRVRQRRSWRSGFGAAGSRIAETVPDGCRSRAVFAGAPVAGSCASGALQALGLGRRRDPSRRHRPLLGREAVGNGYSRRRRSRATAGGRAPARRRWPEALHAGDARRANRATRRVTADRRPRRTRQLAGQRRCSGSRLRGRDLLHGRGRGARERHSADRPGPGRGVRPTCARRGGQLPGGIRGFAGTGDRPFHRSRARSFSGPPPCAPAASGPWTSISPNCSPATRGWRRTVSLNAVLPAFISELAELALCAGSAHP